MGRERAAREKGTGMFVDYVTLMLVNMAAGLVILAAFFWKAFGGPNERSWAPALAMVGLVALSTGLHMTLTHPIPKLDETNLTWANVAFGEMSVLLGVAFLAAALAVGKGWRLHGVGVYALVAGATAVVVGVRVLDLGLSQTPRLTAVGFILTGAAGLLSLLVILAPRVRALRAVAAADLLVSAAIWLTIGLPAYWSHLERFSQ